MPAVLTPLHLSSPNGPAKTNSSTEQPDKPSAAFGDAQLKRPSPPTTTSCPRSQLDGNALAPSAWARGRLVVAHAPSAAPTSNTPIQEPLDIDRVIARLNATP